MTLKKTLIDLKPEGVEYLDFYWGYGEEFELNDYLDDVELTEVAKQFMVRHGYGEGISGYLRWYNDMWCFFVEPVDMDK